MPAGGTRDPHARSLAAAAGAALAAAAATERDPGAGRAGPSRRSSWEGAAAGKCSQVRGSPAGVPRGTGNKARRRRPGVRGRPAPGCVEHVASPGDRRPGAALAGAGRWGVVREPPPPHRPPPGVRPIVRRPRGAPGPRPPVRPGTQGGGGGPNSSVTQKAGEPPRRSRTLPAFPFPPIC